MEYGRVYRWWLSGQELGLALGKLPSFDFYLQINHHMHLCQKQIAMHNHDLDVCLINFITYLFLCIKFLWI